RRPLVRPQAADDADRLFELVEAIADREEGNAVRAELGLVPAGAEAALHATSAHVIDRREGLRQHRRVPVADTVDEAAHADVARLTGEGRVRRDGVETRTVVALKLRRVEVVPDRHPVEPVLVREAPELPQLVEGAELGAGMDAELHGPVKIHPSGESKA